MPEILRVAGATRVLGRSQGYWGLPVRDAVLDGVRLPALLDTHTDDSVTGPGTPTMVTAWQFTPDEIEAIVLGAPVYLTIVGNQHPPVSLRVGEPGDVGD